MDLHLKKMGNSTALVLPPPVLKALGIAAGSTLSMEIDAGRLVLTPKRDLLQELVAQCLPAQGPQALDKVDVGDILKVTTNSTVATVLVVTRAPYHRLGGTIVAPITAEAISAEAGFAVPLTGCVTPGHALVNKLHPLDLTAVQATRIEKAPDAVSVDARRRLAALLE